MKRKRRRIVSGACLHVYQRGVNGYNLFYELVDYILFYTILSTTARNYGIKLLEMCIMINHVHILIADAMRDVCAFLRDVFAIYAREFNLDAGREGPLFHKSFGSAVKIDEKKIRSCINYIGNNPVEKKICKSAEEYQWGFLAYCDKANPHSTYKPLRNCSAKLRAACKEVKLMADLNRILHYGQLRRLYKGLSNDEQLQLTDYIIRLYNPFDYDELISYYGDYSTMILAMKSNTGSEYDIKEMYDSEPDTIYDKLKCIVERIYGNGRIKCVTSFTVDEKMKLARIMLSETNATTDQVCRFLHLELAGR